MDSSDDDDDRNAAAAVEDSQLDVDDDAMNALLEEEIAAAMQADSDDLNEAAADEVSKEPPPRSNRGRAGEDEDDDVDERKDGGSRRGNGDLFNLDGAVAGKRPARASDEIKAGELDSDLDDTGDRDRAEQPSTATASGTRASAPAAAQSTDARRLHNRENYQRREQRRKQIEAEHNRIRNSLPSAAASKRYDTFRRARLSHSTIKSLIAQCTGSNKIEGQLPAVLSAMGRVYVGAVVEEARRAMRSMGHTGNVRSMHLREAHRRLADRGDIVVPNCSDGRKRGIGVAGWRRDGQFFREMG